MLLLLLLICWCWYFVVVGVIVSVVIFCCCSYSEREELFCFCCFPLWYVVVMLLGRPRQETIKMAGARKWNNFRVNSKGATMLHMSKL